MFPLSDTIKSNKFPLITLLLIAINIYVFFKEMTSINFDTFISQYALIPNLINFTNPSTLLPFFTAMFLHGGFMHIISNLWFLWIFGDNVEARLGKLWYIFLFIGGGLVGNFAQYLLDPSSPIPILGASGAISAVLGAYYIFFPQSRIKSLVFLFFIITITEIPAVLYLFYWFILQLFSGIASFSSQQTGGVAVWAHIAGFISGIVFARNFNNKKPDGYIEGEIVS